MAKKLNNLDPVHFGLSFGAVCFLGVLFLGVMSTYFDYGTDFVFLLGTVYKGFEPTMVGSFMGAGWAIADGFICGWLFAWFYNKLA